jgi:hypothetical protein
MAPTSLRTDYCDEFVNEQADQQKKIKAQK